MNSLYLAIGFSLCAIAGFFLTPLMFVVAAIFGVLYAVNVVSHLLS